MGERGVRGRLLATLLVAGLAVAGTASEATAHGLDKFSVNTYAGLLVRPERVRVSVVVDYAEIPSTFERLTADIDRDNAVTQAEAAGYTAAACAKAVAEVSLTADGAPVPLRVESSQVAYPSYVAAFPRTRLWCGLGADLATVGRTLVLTSRLHAGRAGWHEIVAAGEGVRLARSDVADHSASAVLTAFPGNPKKHLDQRSATVEVASGEGAGFAAPLPARGAPGAGRLAAAFESLATRDELGAGFVLLALLASVALGAAHAFAPGHGKTVMAAYLVGRGGSLRHAAALGLSVTVTHTLGVLVLGIALSTASVLSPERLYPVLGLASGVLVVGVGAGLLWRATRHGRRHHHHDGEHPHHDHDHDHPHQHHDHDEGRHRHGGRAHRHDLPAEPGLRGVLALGLAGGLVPSPSALLVLLGAIALDRAWFGVLLVAAYGAGMALTLLGVGLLLVRTRGRVRRWSERRTGRIGRGVLVTASALPVVTALAVVAVGLGLTVQAAARV